MTMRSASSSVSSSKRAENVLSNISVFFASPTVMTTPGARWPMVTREKPLRSADRSRMPRSIVPLLPAPMELSLAKAVWPAPPRR